MERIMLVPEKQQLTLPSVNSPMSSLQATLDTINANNSLSDDTRWRRYEELLKSFFHFANQGHTAVNIVPEAPSPGIGESLLPFFQDSSSAERILAMINALFPVTIRDKAIKLLQYLSQTPHSGDFKISSQSHLVRNGVVIKNSNLLDLLRYSVHPKKAPKAPTGWYEFTELLLETNVPAHFLAPHFQIWQGRKEPTKRKAVHFADAPSPTARPPSPKKTRSKSMSEVEQDINMSIDNPSEFEDAVDGEDSEVEIPVKAQQGRGTKGIKSDVWWSVIQ
jgi:hypothetical protein